MSLAKINIDLSEGICQLHHMYKAGTSWKGADSQFYWRFLCHDYE